MTGELEDLARIYDRFDPMPDGMIERMQRAARSEVDLSALELDLELLELIERSGVPAGARGASSAYTLRFAYDHIDLLVRVASDEAAGRRLTRLDGWVVPPGQVTVRVLELDGDGEAGVLEASADPLGRFEFSGLPSGMVRLILLGEDAQLATPAFEL